MKADVLRRNVLSLESISPIVIVCDTYLPETSMHPSKFLLHGHELSISAYKSIRNTISIDHESTTCYPVGLKCGWWCWQQPLLSDENWKKNWNCLKVSLLFPWQTTENLLSLVLPSLEGQTASWCLFSSQDRKQETRDSALRWTSA